MNLQPGKKRTTQGNVILICVLFSFVLGITIASYLYLVQGQFNSTVRSHNWNTAMVLAETGVEEGLAFINKYAGDYADSQNWANTAGADGWDINGNVYHIQRTPDPTMGCYDVWVTNNVNSISVCAVGSAFWNQQPVTGPQAPSAAASMDASGVDSGAIVRQVLVQTTNDPLFSVALGCSGAINLNGYDISTDSFDSADPNHSAWNTNLQSGQYSPAFRKADGILATDGAIINADDPGDLMVYGSISTGPGGGTNALQNGSVGDTNWVPTVGIQPGHAQDDMNVVFQNVSLPTATPFPLGPIGIRQPLPPSGNTGGYFGDSENGGLVHSVTVTAPGIVFYVVNGVQYGSYGPYTAPRSIVVTNNGSLVLYVGQALNLGYNGSIGNTTGNAANLCIYGLTNLTSLNLGNLSSFTGTIYAPQADVVLGNSAFTTEFTGSCIARSITLNGNVNVHYDENLRRVGPGRAYVPISWTEF